MAVQGSVSTIFLVFGQIDLTVKGVFWETHDHFNSEIHINIVSTTSKSQ